MLLVETCGRQGTYRYVFMDTAMQMGVMAARQIAERGHLRDDSFQHLHDEPTLRETVMTTA